MLQARRLCPDLHFTAAQPSLMLEELVFGYLTHSGFCETASIAARDLLGALCLALTGPHCHSWHIVQQRPGGMHGKSNLSGLRSVRLLAVG